MYYWFYTQTDPREVQAANDTVEKDQGEFLEFNNLKFNLPTSNVYNPSSLIIAHTQDIVPFKDPIKIIYDLNHEPVFEIYQN